MIWEKDTREVAPFYHHPVYGMLARGDDGKWYLSPKEMGPFRTMKEAKEFAAKIYAESQDAK